MNLNVTMDLTVAVKSEMDGSDLKTRNVTWDLFWAADLEMSG